MKKYCHLDSYLHQENGVDISNNIEIGKINEELNEIESDSDLSLSGFDKKLQKFRNLNNISNIISNGNENNRKLLDQDIVKILDDINILCESLLPKKDKNSDKGDRGETDCGANSVITNSSRKTKICSKVTGIERSSSLSNKIYIEMPETFLKMEGIHGLIKVSDILVKNVSFITFEVYTICENGTSFKIILNRSFDELTESLSVFNLDFMSVFRIHENHGIFLRKKFSLGVIVKLMDSKMKVLKIEFKEYSVVMEKNKQPAQYFLIENQKNLSRWKFQKCNYNLPTAFTII